jgi:HD-like signal output (HDOD) protein/CheY-like chemotaxis protein
VEAAGGRGVLTKGDNVVEAEQGQVGTTSVLVVSGSQEFLAKVEAQLRPHEREWRIEMATDAAAAITSLASGPVDVVVAEAGLTTPDGTSLLVHVRDAHPAAVRIVLGNEGSASSCLAVAHQVLSPAVDATIVRGVILRSIELRSRLTDPTVLELLGSLPSLPSPSGALIELQQVLGEAEVDTAKVARVVATDVAMSTKLLQIVNSSYYGLSRTVDDAGEAVRLLGSRLVGEILLTVGLLDAVTKRGSAHDAELSAMRDRSLARADLAATLADKAGRATASVRRVWNGAFLHDVGAMLLVGSGVEHDSGVERLHATIGGALLAIWGLPPQLVELVAMGDLAPTAASSEAHLYSWLAGEFQRESTAEPTPSDDGTATPEAVDDEAEHAELVSSVIRWAGLSRIDLSVHRAHPVAA